MTEAEARTVRAILGKHAEGFEFEVSRRLSFWRAGRPDLVLYPRAGDPSYRIPEIDPA